MCSPLTPDGAQRSSGLVVVQTFSCPGISFFISSSSLSDFLPSSHDHLVKMWDQRSHKTPLFELTGKKSSQCKTTLAAFSRSFTTRRNVGKHRSNPINKSRHHGLKLIHSGHSDKVLCCDWSSSEVINTLIQLLKSFDIHFL